MAKVTSLKENQQVYVLHTYPFKETSLIVEIFSKEFGRVSLVAKGARRPKSALRGMLQAFQALEASWSGIGELKTLHGIDWCDQYLPMEGNSLICGFYLNELLLRLLPKEDNYESLFNFYHTTMENLSQGTNIEVTLRRFELKLLLELGYEVALKADANSNEIKADKTYYYEAEQGALEKFRTEKSIKVIGQTLIDMGNDNFDSATTELQSKNLMRFLINYYLGDKPLNSKQLFLNI
jgi:DNA repair protein RecO (recombination protein O)